MSIRARAIVLAGGKGSRMNSRTAKQYMELGRYPVLYYSLKAFEESSVEDIVVVTGSGEEEYVRRHIVEPFGFSKVRQIVSGGRERYHSVYAGLCAMEEDTDICLIHDGARPLVTQEIIEDAIRTAACEGACVAAVPVKDTIRIGDEAGYGAETPKRSSLWAIQTPQAFDFALIRDAYREWISREAEFLAEGLSVTDDGSVVELLRKKKVKLSAGSYENIKITTPEDLEIGEVLLKRREKGGLL